jgi:hypothetical protein
MANKRDSTREKEEKHTLLVIGSPKLNPQESLPQVKKTIKRSPPSLWTSFHRHHRSSSTRHLCLMAKGDQKVQNDDTSDVDCGSDSDDEYASPTYDELADLLKEYIQIIRKSKAKCGNLKDENKSLVAKYDIVVKASDELKEENKTVIH